MEICVRLICLKHQRSHPRLDFLALSFTVNRVRLESKSQIQCEFGHDYISAVLEALTISGCPNTSFYYAHFCMCVSVSNVTQDGAVLSFVGIDCTSLLFYLMIIRENNRYM